MAQLIRTFILVFFISALLLGCSSNQVNEDLTTAIPKESSEKLQEKPANTYLNETENTDAVDEHLDSSKVEQSNTEQSGTTNQKIKYYVNRNYFIKPVNPDDPNKVVLLTFDDTPRGENTVRILNILDKYQAKAIFFINGHYAVKNKELVKEIYNRGHIIGNHAWWHENLNYLNEEDTKNEIIKVSDLVEEITGERPKYFRPPNGALAKNPYAKEILANEQMQRMNWSLGSRDWEIVKPELAEKVVEEIKNNVISGSNILMHDIEITANALDKILAFLVEEGYTFVLPTEVIIEN
ncbi:hypothetical protein BHF71_03805 [Vulcanibacillus modesticaldus]|uniref:NodB homology domain-containing protein n=1 Tax=Vulcanibacillus modesticaldus TaxID=337097 RepID=A0A1D2YSK0_9BACI|nr:polysaccharide deacetylase family protein [Vulcanibacillus modesticaldus]OEF97270.1 hypothetical protein BHF71_03805 [Vulcanibacillus modesticaldus]